MRAQFVGAHAGRARDYNRTTRTSTTGRTVPPTCANDCAYAMNPASDIDVRMVCSWLLYMSRHAVSILTLRHTHSLTALHSLRWHMALAQTSRTHNMQTVQRGEGGWEAHRRDAEGSRGRVAGEGTMVQHNGVMCLDSAPHRTLGRPALAYRIFYVVRLLVVFVGFSIVLLAHIRI